MEEWREIPGYNGEYEVSNLGRVRSSKKVLKPWVGHGGYEVIGLHVDGHKDNYYVHRLVADAFIDNPDNKPSVNHLNENKRCNNVENLEWVSHHENNTYGTYQYRQHLSHLDHHPSEETRRKMSKSHLGRTLSEESLRKLSESNINHPSRSKRVGLCDEEGNVIEIYPSAMEAHRQTGIPQPSISASCAKGRPVGGYQWVFV